MRASEIGPLFRMFSGGVVLRGGSQLASGRLGDFDIRMKSEQSDARWTYLRPVQRGRSKPSSTGRIYGFLRTPGRTSSPSARFEHAAQGDMLLE
ncbi:hypothetical protein BV20DRAFT_966921 [Pilatotrama ljubarskyi]|nr:hypothetical protein BV20DRAFT_966921 [Pilatotrama ljubarskyi]